MKRFGVYIAAAAIALPGSVALAGQDSAKPAHGESYPVELFMNTCVAGRGEAGAVASQAAKSGFQVATEDIARRYLLGKAGKAWYASNEHGEFGIAVLEDGICSVFLHKGDSGTLLASLESRLPAKNSGSHYTRELVSRTGFLTTTGYRIFHGDVLTEEWVITVSDLPESGLAAILSYIAR